MRHLTREELVDFADGTRAEASAPHLASCRECCDRVADLRSTIRTVAAVHAPEPSPLFWDHFSARVRQCVASDASVGTTSWRERFAWRGLVMPLAIAAGALVVAAVLTTVTGRSTVAVPVPRIAMLPISSEAVEGTSLVPPDDSTLDLVADLGTELDWDDIHDSGVVAHTGLMDRAVDSLSAGERVELGKLLKQELAGGGN